MHKNSIVLILFLLSCTSLFAEKNVAVLNAILGEGVPFNASAIVADKINEQFVNSDDYTAIDRAYISNIQAEKNFQLSGDVKEEDIKDLGNTIGADYVCVAYVGLLGSTYSVSARLIEVETARVVLQESHRMQGEIDVLFTVAEVVGAELVGADLAIAESVTLAAAATVEQTSEEPTLVYQENEEGWDYYEDTETSSDNNSSGRSSGGVISDPRKHFILSWMFPGYLGDETPWPDDGYSFYEQDLYYSTTSESFLFGFVEDVKTLHIGVDFHMLFPVWRFLYIGGGATFTSESLNIDGTITDESYTNFFTFEPYASFGGIVAFFDIFQVYGGITAGGMFLVLGDHWTADGDSAIGFSLGFELGVTAYLGSFGLDMRYKLSKSPAMIGDGALFSSAWNDAGNDSSFGHQGLTLGLGFAF